MHGSAANHPRFPARVAAAAPGFPSRASPRGRMAPFTPPIPRGTGRGPSPTGQISPQPH